MLGKIQIGINVETGREVTQSLDHLIAERGLIQANSGGGKSYGARVIAEQSYGKIQEIIISPKNEFRTLREKYDYILIGKNTPTYDVDIEIDARHAGKLAEKILETGVNAIIDLSQLPHDRIKFVKNFVDAMNNANEKLWHPVLVIIDEIHIFAPEKGYGEAESLNAIAELASTGRDKGYCLIGATQRLSKFNNNVASELNVKFIGKCSLDTDMQRAGKELGFKPADYIKLRTLGNPNYHFYCFGAGLSDDIIKIKFIKAHTTHIAGWQRVKNKVNPPTPTKIKALLNQFADLPQEAEKEIKTKEDLQKKNIELIREINRLSKQQTPQIDAVQLEHERKRSYAKGYDDAEKYWKTELDRLQILHNKLLSSSEDIIAQRNALSTIIQKSTESTSEFISKLKDLAKIYPTIKEIQIENFQFKIRDKPISEHTQSSNTSQKGTIQTIPDLGPLDDIKLRDGAIRMLKVLAQLDPKTISRTMLKLLSEIGNPSTFSTYITELKKLQYVIESSTGVNITPLGMKNAGSFEQLPIEPDQLLEAWTTKFREGGAKMLRELYNMHPLSLTKDELMQRVGITNPSTFSTYKTELQTCGLIIDEGGSFKINKDIFGGKST